MNAATTSTDYLARHGIEDAKFHLMPAKYAEAIFSNPKSRLAWAEAKVRCNAQKRLMHSRISPKRVQVQDGELPENMCQKCVSHLGK
jgi:hypothetical protein